MQLWTRTTPLLHPGISALLKGTIVMAYGLLLTIHQQPFSWTSLKIEPITRLDITTTRPDQTRPLKDKNSINNQSYVNLWTEINII